MPTSFRVRAMRVGPIRLISTAESRGESKLTAAAEWMTTSTLQKVARSASLSPSPSRLTSPLTVLINSAFT